MWYLEAHRASLHCLCRGHSFFLTLLSLSLCSPILFDSWATPAPDVPPLSPPGPVFCWPLGLVSGCELQTAFCSPLGLGGGRGNFGFQGQGRQGRKAPYPPQLTFLPSLGILLNVLGFPFSCSNSSASTQAPGRTKEADLPCFIFPQRIAAFQVNISEKYEKGQWMALILVLIGF